MADDVTVQTTLHGREFGLDAANLPVFKGNDGKQYRGLVQDAATGLVYAGASVYSGAGGEAYRWASTAAAPIAGPLTTFGVLSADQPLAFTGLKVGSVVDIVNLQCLRTGAAANIAFEIRLGTVNGTSATLLYSQNIGTGNSRPRFSGQITITSATTADVTGSWLFGSSGIAVENTTDVALGFDITTAGTVYLVISANSITNPDTASMQSGLVRSFR